LFEYVAIIS